MAGQRRTGRREGEGGSGGGIGRSIDLSLLSLSPVVLPYFLHSFHLSLLHAVLICHCAPTPPISSLAIPRETVYVVATYHVVDVAPDEVFHFPLRFSFFLNNNIHNLFGKEERKNCKRLSIGATLPARLIPCYLS